MKAVIYYFSGTGNSLTIARDIAYALRGEVLSIATFKGDNRIPTDVDTVGIVYPVYAFGIPGIVERFIAKLDLKKDQYVFTVANYAKVQGAGITKAHRLLKRKGIKPAAGFGVVMPNNYTPFGEAIFEEKQNVLFKAERDKVKKIAELVRDRKTVSAETGFFLARWLLAEPIVAISSAMMPGEDKNFKLNEKCNGCGMCEKVCPVGNIEMQSGRPVWKHCCEQCLACFHWCPNEAIEIGKSTERKRRYRHPNVTLTDMVL